MANLTVDFPATAHTQPAGGVKPDARDARHRIIG